MANAQKNKGRRAERSASAYFEHWGWKVLDIHHNDAIESISNADLIIFDDGPIPGKPEDIIERGLEVQVKYTSGSSYGVKSIYNAHEARNCDLGAYANYKDPDKLSNRNLAVPHAINWPHDSIWTAPAGWLFDQNRNVQFIELLQTSRSISQQHVQWASDYDVVFWRKARKPWMVTLSKKILKRVGFLALRFRAPIEASTWLG